MNGRIYEAVVQNGQIRLSDHIQLPDNTTVYVTVPEERTPARRHITSPRLAHPEEAADFRMDVTEEAIDADL